MGCKDSAEHSQCFTIVIKIHALGINILVNKIFLRVLVY